MKYKELIAEVMLYSQGFSCAKELSRQIVPFFDRCSSLLSSQSHYDFGLRALKSVLVARQCLAVNEDVEARIFAFNVTMSSDARREPRMDACVERTTGVAPPRMTPPTQ